MDETPTFLDDVEVVGDDGMGLLTCRRQGRTFHVPRYNLLGGGAGVQVGVHNLTLILPRWFVHNLGFDLTESGPIGRAHLSDPERARRILVVEPDADSRDALCALLECWGHHVVCAESAQQALGFIVEMRLDAIVLSLVQPDMDGAEFARTLRGLRVTPAPQLVAYAALAPAVEVAVDTLLLKPDVDGLERLFGPTSGQEASRRSQPGRRSR